MKKLVGVLLALVVGSASALVLPESMIQEMCSSEAKQAREIVRHRDRLSYANYMRHFHDVRFSAEVEKKYKAQGPMEHLAFRMSRSLDEKTAELAFSQDSELEASMLVRANCEAMLRLHNLEAQRR